MNVADNLTCGARSVESSTDVNYNADAAPDRSIIAEALQQLSPVSRQILIETVIRRHTLQATATRLGMPEASVRSRLHYAMHQLRRELDAARAVQTSE
jgi:RNA polymerase sigma factor (sigma-70 family)